jgi:hypothetical protein
MVFYSRGVEAGMVGWLDFEIYVELETGLITGHAGVPGLIEAFRQTGTAAVIYREVKLKSRKRGLSAPLTGRGREGTKPSIDNAASSAADGFSGNRWSGGVGGEVGCP